MYPPIFMQEFIVKYRVQQTLAALAHGQSAANQVGTRLAAWECHTHVLLRPPPLGA